MKHNSENWLLKVEGLTKVYGTPNSNSIDKTGPLFDSNICPETSAIVACAKINFELFPGEVLGIVGESGSGKSTIVKMLYFDMEHTSGHVLFNRAPYIGKNILNQGPPLQNILIVMCECVQFCLAKVLFRYSY